jgi:ribonucleoside-diphosphate reductase alpha chain
MIRGDGMLSSREAIVRADEAEVLEPPVAEAVNPTAPVVDVPRFDSGRPARAPHLALVRKVEVDRSRDALLTDFGKKTLEDRYLLAGESYQDMFARVATAYADDADHAQRVYDYISSCGSCRPPRAVERRRQPRPADLLLPERRVRLAGRHPARLERERGLASNGGGIGTYWGGVRSIGEKVKGAARPRASSPSSA